MRRFIALAAALALAGSAASQEGDPRKRLAEHLVRECQKHFDARRAEVAALKTADDVRARQARIKAKFLESIGPLPEKTPLAAKTLGTVAGDGFVVEKVVYESRPNHHVTANLYLPAGKGPFPGVIVPCGHSTNGKAAEAYQRASILLAKNGIAALCYDPIGQGERLQLLKDDGKPGISGSTGEHTLIGIGAWLVGQSTATYRIWDGIRSLDYLESRPEIDAKRLGCCGNSGGGTMTAYLMALDDRIWAAVPSCYITSLEKLFATIGAQDAEQNIVGQVAFGMEHADYLTLRAPKPTLMAVATQDFFSIDGAWTTFREASGVYSKLGHGERVALFEFDDKHGFSKPRREATVRWMRRWLLGVDDAVVETAFPSFKDADLQCTRSGQVLADYRGVSAFDLSVRYADAAKPAREAFAKREPAERARIVRETLRLPAKIPAATRTDSGWTSFDGLPLAGLHHPGDMAVVVVLPENRPAGKSDPLAKRYRDAGRTVVEVDLRGLGNLPVATKPSYFSHDFRPAMLSLHLDRPLLGQRVADLLAVVEAVAGKGTVQVVAEGSTAYAALHAAALDARISAVTLERPVVSWDSVVRTPLGINQLSNVVPGVLQKYDLPQLATLVAPRSLTLRGPVDAAQRPVAAADAQRLYPAGVRVE